MKPILKDGKESIKNAEKNLGWPRAPRVFTSGEEKKPEAHGGNGAAERLEAFFSVVFFGAAAGLCGLALGVVFVAALLMSN